jgi:hypothetical protein
MKFLFTSNGLANDSVAWALGDLVDKKQQELKPKS